MSYYDSNSIAVAFLSDLGCNTLDAYAIAKISSDSGTTMDEIGTIPDYANDVEFHGCALAGDDSTAALWYGYEYVGDVSRVAISAGTTMTQKASLRSSNIVGAVRGDGSSSSGGVPPTHQGPADCPFCYAARGQEQKGNPIALLDGEKREQVTDLGVITPAGTLDFTRSFRQGTLTNPNLRTMGLGWTHNHNFLLTKFPGTPNTIIVRMPRGGELHLTEASSGSNTYNGDPGSTARIDWDGIQYTLTTQDKTQYIFDASGQLSTDQWQLTALVYPSGETWTYSYDATSKQLTAIADTYGKGLQFSYLSNAGQYDDGQLWRVGDQESSGLDGVSPSGRYVEFSYVQEKLNGSATGNLNPLLVTVRDVRGNTWTYDYYGQDVGEDDSNQLNFLTEFRSPMVERLGSEILLDRLTYTMNGAAVSTITQERGEGLVSTEWAFQPSGQNLTTETTAERTSIYRFADSVLLETQDAAGNITSQPHDDQFRPAAQMDANGNQTSLDWDSDGKYLNHVTDALGNLTTFDYNRTVGDPNEGALLYSVDAEGRKTEYTYGDTNNPRLPTRIKVIAADGVTALSWQEFGYDSMGRTLEERTLDPSGSPLLSKVTRSYGTTGNGAGLLESVTQLDLLVPANNVSTTYTYDSAGRVIKTQKSSLFGSCQISFTVYDDAGNVVASICNYQNASADPTTAAEAAALYDLSAPEVNRVTTYAYDSLGRRVQSVTNAGVGTNAANAQTTLTAYDALDRVIRTISNYVPDAGISNPYTAAHSAFDHGTDNTQNLVTDTAYNARGLVRAQTDVLGNVTLYGYDDADRLVKTVQSASQPTYNNDYTGTAPDPSLDSYSANSNSDQDIVATQVYDAAGNLVQAVDALGSVTYTVYDALNRPVKTVRSAKAEATLNFDVGDTGYNAANDPRSASYAPSAGPDRDLIETTEYDALGRVIRAQRLLENRPSEIWETTLYGYDTLGRQVKVIRSASQPNYDLSTDPDLSEYSANANADLDIVTQTTYDAHGRLLDTEDALGSRTRFVYDGLNRQVRAIANFVDQGEDPAAWVWSNANVRWEMSTGTAIDHGANSDQNIIRETVYDSDGNVQETRDVLGRVTRNVYDSVGRVVRTITNYVPQGTSDPVNWLWSLANTRWEDGAGNAISFGTDNDENIIASTEYDAGGRVAQTVDHRNNATLSFYDTLGRRVKTVANSLAQGATDPVDWVWDETNTRWEDGAGSAISFGSDNDQNRITTTSYDLAGRVTAARDSAGVETRYAYDALGRRTQTIANYVDGVFDTDFTDQDLISATSYNKGGQAVTTTDVRGTQTAFTYDRAGRRITVTQAAESFVATTAYTGYDKAGRTLRTITNWSNDPLQPAPDDRDAVTGNWLFVPANHGMYNDRDLVTMYAYDLTGRQTQVTDPLGNASTTSYFKDGQVAATTDPLGVVTLSRYDGLRRRTRVVQNFVDPGEDPALWIWNTGWKQSDGTTAIAHGTNNDQNVIVDLMLDLAGRVISQREPRGNITSYAYDQLNRRKSLINPLSKTWATAYSDLTDGKTQTTMTLPGITGAANYQVQRQFDRLGRAYNLAYGSPTVTHDVTFTYDNAGNRAKLSEFSAANFTTKVRETTYGYDDAHRLTGVGFDENGDGTVEQTVNYEYDAGGLRTKLTLPGSLDVIYTYDQRGQLVSLKDWDNQTTQFAYDNVGRHVATERASGLRSRYEYDAGGRLRALRHLTSSKTLAEFLYEVDARGNRTQAQETLPHPATTNDVTLGYNDKSIVTQGAWANVSGFKQSTEIRAALGVGFFGDSATLTMGTGPDHSLYDVYIDGSLWQSFDGYAASAGQTDIEVTLGVNSRKLTSEGLHVLEIRNRSEHQSQSSGSKVRFKQLVIADQEYDFQTISYSYDALARLTEARCAPGLNTAAGDTDLLRRYQYSYDLSGNQTQQIATVAGTSTTTNYTYNAANQMVSDGTNTLTYDDNGNLTSDGVNSYTWDRANRLLTMGGSSYTYDGAGNRISQTVGVDVTKYLLDLQPGLATVLQATQGSDTTRYVHAPRGIHAQQDASDNWTWMLQDGLGSVRSVVDSSLNLLESRLYEPYGTPFGTSGSVQTRYGFTGEVTDANDLLYLRARYYAPGLGTFTGLDPFEGQTCTPMSLNGYSWVEGNVPNAVDPSGMIYEKPSKWDKCASDVGISRKPRFRRIQQSCMIGNTLVTDDVVNVLATASFGEIRSGGSAALAISVAASINKLRAGTELAAFGGYGSVGGLYGAVFIGACGKEAFATSPTDINYNCTNNYVAGVLSGQISEDIGGIPSTSSTPARLMQVTLDHINLQLQGHCSRNNGAYFYQRNLQEEEGLAAPNVIEAVDTHEIAIKVDQIYRNMSLRIAHTFDMRWASQLQDLKCCMQNSNQMMNSSTFDYVYAGYGNDGVLISTEDMINKGAFSLQTFNATVPICASLRSGCGDDKNPACYIFPRSVRQQCRNSSSG